VRCPLRRAALLPGLLLAASTAAMAQAVELELRMPADSAAPAREFLFIRTPRPDARDTPKSDTLRFSGAFLLRHKTADPDATIVAVDGGNFDVRITAIGTPVDKEPVRGRTTRVTIRDETVALAPPR